MAKRRDLDTLLRDWNYRPDDIVARVLKGSDGRPILQMRVDLGILQMETKDRPDGQRPHGERTYYDYLIRESLDEENQDFTMTAEQCSLADQEFSQFYHRRVCWLSLREYRRAVEDADHTLSFMDFVRDHSPNEDWTISHEQYRPFVLFHRVQAAVLAELEENGPESAIAELNRGLNRFKQLYVDYEAEDKYSEDEFVQRLNDLKTSLKTHFKIGRSAEDLLAEAIEKEDYETAAKLRDELARNKRKN
ncbi:MAG: UvrB/UvrC motif-containing protein [Pirellulales bacterium]|nr:UvrB/UvrC motif-containing protein [Pirellulales bacterium]